MRTLLVASLTVLALAGSVFAEGEGPLEAFGGRIRGIRTRVDVANRNVRSAIDAKDYASWMRLHDAYVQELWRAQREIEEASGQLMIACLARGDVLSAPHFEAIDLAAALAANYARHRVIVSGYSTLLRNGISYEKRGDALSLLQRQGIYEPDAAAAGTAQPVRSSVLPSDSPLSGRIPGNAEAAAHLTKWQSASIKAQAALQRVSAFETELASTSTESRLYPTLQQRLAQARAQYEALTQEVLEWREKYYQAGGR